MGPETLRNIVDSFISRVENIQPPTTVSEESSIAAWIALGGALASGLIGVYCAIRLNREYMKDLRSQESDLFSRYEDIEEI